MAEQLLQPFFFLLAKHDECEIGLWSGEKVAHKLSLSTGRISIRFNRTEVLLKFETFKFSDRLPDNVLGKARRSSPE